LGVDGTRHANDGIRERFTGSSGSVVRRRPVRMASLTRSSDGSGSLPSPRLVRPCRSPGRTFEVSRRITVSCSPPRGSSQQPGPRGLRSSLERGGISAVPVPSAPVGFADRLSWDSSGFAPLSPFIDLIPGVRLPAVSPPLRTRAARSNRVPTSSFRTTSPVFSADRQGSHLASHHRSRRRRTLGLVASRCQS